MIVIPDNLSHYEAHEAQEARSVRKRPICWNCDNPITTDHYYVIMGRNWCPGCIDYCMTYVDDDEW